MVKRRELKGNIVMITMEITIQEVERVTKKRRTIRGKASKRRGSNEMNESSDESDI